MPGTRRARAEQPFPHCAAAAAAALIVLLPLLQGGNDLKSTARQVANQQLVRGNQKLLGNVCLRIPVRVVRKNPDKRSYTKHVYTYDGLYWVTRCWRERGLSGFIVYKYELLRLPGQPQVHSEEVHWGNTNGKCLPPDHKPQQRPGYLLSDISGGLHRSTTLTAFHPQDSQKGVGVLFGGWQLSVGG